MGRSIVIPLHDRRRSVEDVREIREILERLGELSFHYPPLVVDHSLAELYSAGVGELDLDAEEHELQEREERAEAEAALAAELVRPVRELATPSSGAELDRDRPLPLAAIDQEGSRTDAPEPLDPDAEAPRLLGMPAAIARLRRLAPSHDYGRARRIELVRPPFRDHAEEVGYVSAVEELRRESDAIAGRPGWRVDRNGREWYSSEWLGRTG